MNRDSDRISSVVFSFLVLGLLVSLAEFHPALAQTPAASNAGDTDARQQLLEQQRQAQKRAAAINVPALRSALSAANGNDIG
ncbi:hypothetical protein PHO31112_04916 [Pandoraea horticolens]|uniref:Uncharacterized protein n=1 Tax=Pandoraea horticolens TaxID=2508298 RepID=A0A5E4YZI6_9BURK|nr:hypothetical protein [Pandoraea horticolens]VVE54289.1 hypothetical protein PHO31112_04916 [Pandoraea horticolens]